METTTSNSNNVTQTEHPPVKWKKMRIGYAPNGTLFQTVLIAQQKINPELSLEITDDKGEKFTPKLLADT